MVWVLALAAITVSSASGAQQPSAQPSERASTLLVGSKRFTESYVLGEILVASARQTGTKAEHRPGLGNTAIVYAALRSGAIDLYPEYTGTIAREILKLDRNPPLAELNERLAALGLAAAVPLGFNNTYALAMREEAADTLGVTAISDLARRDALRLGFSQEFIARADGWAGLKAAYGLPHGTPSGLDHGLAYEAIAAGRVDVIDVYSTDAKVARYRVRVLADDRAFFPRYDAVLLFRADAPARFPAAWQRIARIGGSIDEQRMIALNAAVEIDGKSFAEAARTYFDGGAATSSGGARRTWWQAVFAEDLPRLLREHLVLTFASLAAAVLIGVPLGVLAIRHERLGQLILGAVGVVQTVPSLALLALLIAAMGVIGFWPALIALVLYALLPIVRNTHTGLSGVRGGLRQAALALGLRGGDRLRAVELPLAWPTILAGVKTSAVINVGTATIAAFVGAGGLGERIVQGLAVNDSTLLVAGALPAAVLAILVQLVFELIERRTAPWLRLGARS
jgi:osmoprotectant transport system permease protein